MKLLRYGAPGHEKPGMLDADGKLRDLSQIIHDIGGATLLPEGLARLAKIDPKTLPLVAGTPRLGACVSGIGKFVCIGLNFADHAKEAGLTVPPEPILFLKANSAICGPNDATIIPRGSLKTDWEVELGVVIGKPAKYVTEANALDHVAGYCVVNDVSERSYQIERAGQWDKGKGCDTFGPTGPWLVTKDEIADPQNLAMKLTVDGQIRQNGSTKTMIYGVKFLIAYLSQFFTLNTGDVIATGTPPGVGMGMKPPTFLKPGQTVELSIEGLGTQKQVTVADA